ncbi:Tfp pilus assembly protein PilF [Pseudochelatococcus lubricantis]|uniref:Tfp pilus assembly protein PilF n=1 Tax=Pseudochelatococcus lubricantis TaxID=1538102 RepID=A0ABX0V2P4_9HYPH|nr:hypothetical protein [Pseudochelatococcus lubricantis]NIJ59408.1 Tfp pilus assembly protein PilF [Pseudochelatococcus lubricantis]
MRTEDVRLLASLGFIAVMRSRDAHARAIFEGVMAARPEQEAGAVGLAMLHLKDGEYDRAIELLRPFSFSETALAFLGLSFFRKGDRERAMKILRDAVVLSSGGDGGAFAQQMLNAIEAEVGSRSPLV